MIGKIRLNIQSSVAVLENSYLVPNNTIAKHSPNIIDLIEVGDHVNGFRIDEIGDKVVWHLTQWGDDDTPFKNKDIETILTHEQYEIMTYKVGEE